MSAIFNISVLGIVGDAHHRSRVVIEDENGGLLNCVYPDPPVMGSVELNQPIQFIIHGDKAVVVKLETVPYDGSNFKKY